MSGETFDLVALIRAVLIGLGSGCAIAAIGILVNVKSRTKRQVAGWIMLGAGVALLLIVILFFSWPNLIVTPDLSGLAQAEAEVKLEKKGLIPEAKPLFSSETEAGRVVTNSQDPVTGIKVRRGTTVSFGVAVGTSLGKPVEGAPASVSLFRPKSGEKVRCERYADGVYRFSVVGSSTGLSDRLRLLLWVRPVKPSSETPGWYLQRLPVNGIQEVKPDGSWQGIAQIGNVQWPPREGDVLDIAVTVVDTETAKKLQAELGIVTHIDLPGIASDIASGVVVK